MFGEESGSCWGLMEADADLPGGFRASFNYLLW